MPFISYPSIENHYQSEYITKAINANSEIESASYVIQEKIHGANFQVIYDEAGYSYASRNQTLESIDGFYGANFIPKLLEPYHDEIVSLYNQFGAVSIFGELFGKGVQKGVNYGDQKQYRIFDIHTHDKGWLTFKECTELQIFKDLHVPLFGYFTGLNRDHISSLAEGVEQTNSGILLVEDNNIEGFVVKAFDKILLDHYGRVFYLKIKSERFKEREKSANKEPKQLSDYDLVCRRWNDTFLEYLNDNRLDSVTSKLGPIKETKQFGVYIKAMMEDAIKDFNKDHENAMLADVAKGDLKKVYNAGKKGAQLLQRRLMEG